MSNSKRGRPALYSASVVTHIRTRKSAGESMRSIAADLSANPDKLGLEKAPCYATIRAICNGTGGYAS